MAQQTLEERLGDRVKRTEGKRGWLLDQYDRPFPNKLYAAAAAIMLDDAERTGKAYFSLQDFKVYVLRTIAATDSAEFFKEDAVSSGEDKTSLDDKISKAKTHLAEAVAHHSELHSEKLEEAIVLDVMRLEIIGGSQLRVAGYTIAELAKRALTYTLGRSGQPFLDRKDRQGERMLIKYKLVSQPKQNKSHHESHS